MTASTSRASDEEGEDEQSKDGEAEPDGAFEYHDDDMEDEDEPVDDEDEDYDDPSFGAKKKQKKKEPALVKIKVGKERRESSPKFKKKRGSLSSASKRVSLIRTQLSGLSP